jgi:hypothetical protein
VLSEVTWVHSSFQAAAQKAEKVEELKKFLLLRSRLKGLDEELVENLAK